MNLIDENALQHHGILGMKWGIRRYQNPDGSLTELGKKHYEKAQAAIDKFSSKKEKAIAKGDVEFARKNLDYLSNQDIQRFTDRIKARTSLDTLKKDATKVTAEKIQNWAQLVSNAANAAGGAINLYNNIAKINNTFNKNNKLKLIKENDNDNDKVTRDVRDFFDASGFKTKTIETTRDSKGNSHSETRSFEKKPKEEKKEETKTESKESKSESKAEKGIKDVDNYTDNLIKKLLKK